MIPDLNNYSDLKTKGLISIQKIDSNNFAIATKQFSTTDGSELPSQVVGVTLTAVNDAITAKQAELDALNAFKTDLEAA